MDWNGRIIVLVVFIEIRSVFSLEDCLALKISLDRYWLEDPLALLIPLLVEELEVLACSLLNFHIHVILEPLNQFLSLLLDCFQSNSQLRKSCEHPADDGITSLAFLVMSIKDAGQQIDNFLHVDQNRIAIRVFSGTIYKHLSEFTKQPDTQLDHPDLIQVLFHCEVGADDSILV